MTKQTKDIFTIVSVLLFAALLIIFGPFAIIWSLNTLFPILAIPFGFYQWAAVILLNLTWMSKTVIKKD